MLIIYSLILSDITFSFNHLSFIQSVHNFLFSGKSFFNLSLKFLISMYFCFSFFIKQLHVYILLLKIVMLPLFICSSLFISSLWSDIEIQNNFLEYSKHNLYFSHRIIIITLGLRWILYIIYHTNIIVGPLSKKA